MSVKIGTKLTFWSCFACIIGTHNLLCVDTLKVIITHNSESQGQEEVAHTYVHL